MIATVTGQAIAASAVASGVVIPTDSDGQTSLRPGGATATIQGTPVALRSSAIIVGTKTYSLPLPSASTGLGAFIMAAFNGGMKSFTEVTPSFMFIRSQIYAESVLDSGDLEVSDPSITFTLKHGGATTTVEGIPVALHTGEVVLGYETIALPVPVAPSASIAIGSHIYAESVLDSGDLELRDSSSTLTLTPGGATTTIGGIPVALYIGEIIVGSNTIAIPVPTALLDGTDSITTVGQVFAASLLDHSDIVISDAAGLFTLKPDGSSVTIAGTPDALQTGYLIVGSRTFTLPSGLRISFGGGEAGHQRANATGGVPFSGRAIGFDIPWSRLLITILGRILVSIIGA